MLFLIIKIPLNYWDIFYHLMTNTYSPLKEDVAYWDYLWALPERKYPGWWDDTAGFSARKKSIISCERSCKKMSRWVGWKGRFAARKKIQHKLWALPERRYPGWLDGTAGFSARKKSNISCERCLNEDIQVGWMARQVFPLEKNPS